MVNLDVQVVQIGYNHNIVGRFTNYTSNLWYILKVIVLRLNLLQCLILSHKTLAHLHMNAMRESLVRENQAL